jgi:hypothetical protein
MRDWSSLLLYRTVLYCTVFVSQVIVQYSTFEGSGCERIVFASPTTDNFATWNYSLHVRTKVKECNVDW